MFGGFEISADGQTVRDTLNRTHQLWYLIEYLIISRNREVSLKDISDVLWPYGGVDNPRGALKNIVYRIRTMFEQHGLPYAKEMIIFKSGTYR